MAGSLPESVARRRAAALAGHTGDEHGARRALEDPDPMVRATALGALARLGVLGDEELRAALRDAAPEVRARAAELTASLDASLRDEDPPVQLVALLTDSDVRVAEVAAFASGERQPPEEGIVAALAVMATQHADALCREAAVAALGAIGDSEGLDAILAGTRDKPAVRRRAVLALAPFSGEAVDAALQEALTDRDWQVRQAAEDLLDVPPT